MKRAEDIIIRPLISERTMECLAEGKYTFIVSTKATKTEIRHAIEKLFNVKVLKVNTTNYQGKIKRMGAHQGRQSKYKKAIIKIDTAPVPEVYTIKGGKETTSAKKYKTGIEDYGMSQ